MHIAALSGSLRHSSYNTGLLHAAATILHDHAIEIVDWSTIPVFNQDDEPQGEPTSVANVRSRLHAADAIIIATPEYNYSLPGGLKNVLDWMSRTSVKPFSNKPVLVVGASAGNYGTVRAQLALRQILTAMNAHTLNKPELLVTQAKSKFTENGELIDMTTIEMYTTVLRAFVDWTERLQRAEGTQQ
jgi:chromate reductase